MQGRHSRPQRSLGHSFPAQHAIPVTAGFGLPCPPLSQLASPVSLTYHSASPTILRINGPRKEHSLKLSRTFCYYGPLLVSLLGSFVCDYAQGQAKPRTTQHCTVSIRDTGNNTCAVTVSNCQVDPKHPDSPQVYLGDDVTWVPPDHKQYSINFIQHTPFSTSTPPPNRSQTATGDPLCNTLGAASPSLCYFEYSLTQNGASRPCDPGVRIVPPGGNLIFFLGFFAVLLVASYLAFRIRSRNRASAAR